MKRAIPILAGIVLAAFAPAAEARDVVIESFDGTPIVAHFYPGDGSSAEDPQPTVMVGPGWAGSGAKPGGGVGLQTLTGALFGAVAVEEYVKAGYNLLTWDPRGFGGSGGTVMIDDPRFEGRDAQALLDFIAEQPEAQLDAPGDPRVGMAGGSYGGGIQLVLAGIDRRVDAITPVIAWNSQVTSLFQDGALKLGWGSLLIAVGVEAAVLNGLGSPAGPQTGHQAPEFYDTLIEGAGGGAVSAENQAFFADNGPDYLLDRIKTPTLLIQGTVDTLFPLDEAIANFRGLADNQVRAGGRKQPLPLKMLFFCGGHGVCLTEAGPEDYVGNRVLAWFDRYLRGNREAKTGRRFAWIADDGVVRSSAAFPGRTVGRISGHGAGLLPIVPGPSGGGALIFATPSPIAVDVEIEGPADEANVLGAPELTMTYSGTGAPTHKTFVYAQIVDPRRDVVVGNITTPIPVVLDGAEHTISRRLEWIAARAPAGGGYTLQITPDSTVYDIQRHVGTIDFSSIDVSIPLREPVLRRRGAK